MPRKRKGFPCATGGPKPVGPTAPGIIYRRGTFYTSPGPGGAGCEQSIRGQPAEGRVPRFRTVLFSEREKDCGKRGLHEWSTVPSYTGQSTERNRRPYEVEMTRCG